MIITDNIVKIFNRLDGGGQNDNGPWGPWSGGSADKKPRGGRNQPNNAGNSNKEKEFDELLKKGQEFLKNLFKTDVGGNNNKNRNPNQKFRQNPPKSIVGIIILVIIVLWLSSGLYKVNPDENAVILYFGKFYAIATPGLNYHIPTPFGKIIKKSVTTVNTEEFGFRSNDDGQTSSDDNDDYQDQGLMLTGDENIVDIDFQIQWQISDIKNFVFNIADPNIAIKKAAESAMREIIARTPIADALSDGKSRIEQEAKILLQEILDSYGAGVHVVLVQLRRVDPPKQVIDAFRDVQTAKADKEREINQAQAYNNDIIPRARGEAVAITEQAKAYQQEVVANAQGQASRFLAVYNQYIKAKSVTKKRMYLETMERIYRDINKIIIDDKGAKAGLMPILPLNQFGQVGQVIQSNQNK